jgi:hypothetical protein
MFHSMETTHTMDWARVIDRNKTALQAVIDGLFTLLGLATRLSPGVYRRVLRSLRPAESAVRRLIVIAARNIVVEAVPVRVRPVSVKPAASPGLRPKGTTEKAYVFPLFDPRKPFWKIRKRKALRVPPRIRVLDYGYDPRISAQFSPPRPPDPPPPPVPDGLVDATRITRRLQALELALDDLPGQALRLARLQQKRADSPGPTFKEPIRPGDPPGYRRRRRREIDEILVECHYLALDSLKINTS